MSLARFVARRSGEILITLFIIATLTFIVLRLMPSDPAGMLLDPYSTPEMKRLQRELWGLDRSYAEQYIIFLKNLVRGEFGVSFFTQKDVYDIIKERLPATVLLFTTMTVLSFSWGVHAGRVIAWRRGGKLEYGSTIIGMFLYSMPVFWLCLMAIWIFSFKLGLFPLGGMKTPELWDTAASTSLHVVSDARRECASTPTIASA